jgi:hypothetical protein
MFTSIYNNHRFVNPVLSDICRKSTNEYIRRLTEKNKEEKNKEEKNKLNINSNLVSSIILKSDENNEPPNTILPILSFFSFISVTYFCYSFYKIIKE